MRCRLLHPFVPAATADVPCVCTRCRSLTPQLDDGDGYDEGWRGIEGKFFVGTSTDLWKRYFRITSEVVASTVRPLATLRTAFAELKRRWAVDDNPDYTFVCEQLKSIRQVRRRARQEPSGDSFFVFQIVVSLVTGAVDCCPSSVGPRPSGHTRRIYSASVRGAREDRAGGGRLERVQPVPDPAGGPVRPRHCRPRQRVRRVPPVVPAAASCQNSHGFGNGQGGWNTPVVWGVQ